MGALKRTMRGGALGGGTVAGRQAGRLSSAQRCPFETKTTKLSFSSHLAPALIFSSLRIRSYSELGLRTHY